MEIKIIINQISKLILLVLVGVFARKKGIVSDEGTNLLAKLMLNITLPLLTFFSITSYRLPEGILREGIFIIVMAIAVMSTSLSIGIFLGTRLGLPDVRKNVYSAQLMIGNTVFLAFPLMKTLFGEIGLIYAIVYYLVSLTFIWTLGVYLFNKHEIKNVYQIFRSLINPCTISFALGIWALLLRIDVLMEKSTAFNMSYSYLYDTFYPLGNTTMSLSMIFIGSIIGKMELETIIEIFKTKEIVLLIIFKMVVIPVIFLLVLQFTKGIAGTTAINVIFIESLMPASTITVALAKENNSDYTFAMEIAIATTIISVVTIPILLQVFHLVN